MKEYLPWAASAFDQSILRGMDGWLSSKEASLLYRLAAKVTGKGAIIEIGSWKGKSTTCLALGSRSNANTEITAIDPHTGSSEHGDVDTYEEFLQNISQNGIADIVSPIRDYSHNVAKTWKKPVELLWIDGAHEYEYVLQDLMDWEPFLVEGGIIAFHDSTMAGPWKVLEDHLYKGRKFHNVCFVHGITYAVKGKPTPVRNRIMLMLRNIAYGLWKIKNTMKRSK